MEHAVNWWMTENTTRESTKKMLKGKLLEMWQPQPQRLSEAVERAQTCLQMWPSCNFSSSTYVVFSDRAVFIEHLENCFYYLHLYQIQSNFIWIYLSNMLQLITEIFPHHAF